MQIKNYTKFIKSLVKYLLLIFFKDLYTIKQIDIYGKYHFNIIFLFSDFKKWSNSEKNVGFKKYYQLAEI